MFSSFEEFGAPAELKSTDHLQVLSEEGNTNASALLHFLGSLEHFPFYPALKASIERHGLRVEDIQKNGNYVELLGHLLDPSKLAYSSRAKGLLEFHRYPARHARTAFEEQLIEGLEYCTDGQGNFYSHFTVAPDQLEAFEALSSEVCRAISRKAGVDPVVTFSTQSQASDTLAVGSDGEPFRTAAGSLLLRPSGHGALIDNLQQLNGDIVIIKNIDNIAPESRHALGAHSKKLLIGKLFLLQEEIFQHLDKLRGTEVESKALEAATVFLNQELTFSTPPEISEGEPTALREFLISRLDRPLRVCGMVRNQGEPGGGPFWVRNVDGTLSGQIIEDAQVDHSDSSAAEIWESSTHFNPVDLICSLRDISGRLYDLQQFIDPSAAMVVDKSAEGRPIKCLERPGLWNGAMAGWNSVFVEVPSETFTPVKTIFDLLRHEHQP